ncbi:YdeI/OmpD-associated family protein [Rubrolithibacter danxiaensis]|uniref:YdeI/OmpD-associated family protein n=1 Tax=Rubrolithibacter danxiaensis TaxID=3390805 RepID=UPI003BF7C510
MIEFDTLILQFEEQGEKTGWTYIEIPADIAQQLKPGNKQTFRVKGCLDAYSISGVALLPMGEGNFIMALNEKFRKGIGKRAGALVRVKLEADFEFSIKIPPDLMVCLEDDAEAFQFFNGLSKSNQSYFINWIESAKTEPTKTKRIAQTINALSKRMLFGPMIRMLKAEKA